MHQLIGQASQPANGRALSLRIARTVPESVSRTTLEEVVGFGRWWFDPTTSQVVLSHVAARYLGVDALHHDGLDSCFIHVVADDIFGLVDQLSGNTVSLETSDFRVVRALNGMRWLRLTHLPPDAAHPGLESGILVDITAIKHSAMRERLGYELTEFLIGAHTLGDAITNVIQLICNNLGWDWGGTGVPIGRLKPRMQ